MDFHVKVEVDEGRLVLVVSGELDEGSGSQLRTDVDGSLADDPEVVVFDLAGVSFMDSRGLGQLLSACSAVESAGTGPTWPGPACTPSGCSTEQG